MDMEFVLGSAATNGELPTVVENFNHFITARLPALLEAKLFSLIKVKHPEMHLPSFDMLATIHWKACLDGMDMEFVLGSAATNGELPTVVDFQLFLRQSCSALSKSSIQRCTCRLSTSPAGISKGATNDPYFPNPAAMGTLEQKLWDTFERAYLLAASDLRVFTCLLWQRLLRKQKIRRSKKIGALKCIP
jgi:hypothetical protein